MQNKFFLHLAKCSFTVVPSINTRLVNGTCLCTMPFGSFRPKFKGPPQGPLVGPWVFLPRCFNYELTLMRVRHPYTNFHHFPTPKSQSNILRNIRTSLNQFQNVVDVLWRSLTFWFLVLLNDLNTLKYTLKQCLNLLTLM